MEMCVACSERVVGVKEIAHVALVYHDDNKQDGYKVFAEDTVKVLVDDECGPVVIGLWRNHLRMLGTPRCSNLAVRNTSVCVVIHQSPRYCLQAQ